MSKKALKRNEYTFACFERYLGEARLMGGVNEILARHHVVLREVYFDDSGRSARAARLELWWWLLDAVGKSRTEIGRIFDRDPTTIMKAFTDLEEVATAMSVALSLDSVGEVTRKIAALTVEKRRAGGMRGLQALQAYHEKRRKVASGAGGQ